MLNNEKWLDLIDTLERLIDWYEKTVEYYTEKYRQSKADLENFTNSLDENNLTIETIEKFKELHEAKVNNFHYARSIMDTIIKYQKMLKDLKSLEEL